MTDARMLRAPLIDLPGSNLDIRELIILIVWLHFYFVVAQKPGGQAPLTRRGISAPTQPHITAIKGIHVLWP
jgi:hypothetical protein